MAKSPTHTPTPWVHHDGDDIIVSHQLGAFPGNVVCASPNPSLKASQRRFQANAAFIVRACNRDHVFDELVRFASNFEFVEKDDGYWLILHGNGTSGKAAFNLGKPERIAVMVAKLLEEDRLVALAKARGEA